MFKKAPTQKGDATELEDALKACKSGFISAGVFSLFINLLMLVPAIYMLQVYDRALGSRSVETLIMLTVILVGLFITLALLQMVRSAILVRVGNNIDQSMNQKIFSAMFRQAIDRPERQSAQPLNDLTSLRQFLTGQGPIAFFDGPWLPVYIAVMFMFHVWYGVFAIIAAIILVALAYANEKFTGKLLAEAGQANIQSTEYAGSCLRNAEVVHAMGMENNLRSKWLQRHLSFLNNQANASDRAGILSNGSKTLRMLFQSLMLGLGGYLAIQQEISPGMVIAGSILMGRALAPLDLMIASWKGFSSARSAYTRLNDLFDKYHTQQSGMPLPPPEGNLSIQSMVVVPPGGQSAALSGIGFALDKGDMLAVVGPSAAGKSTLARSVLGIWALANGTVRLDGADIHQWDKSQLGPHIGYLPQDIELFSGTISENISRFGQPDPGKVVEAAKLAGVHELILQLPNGYDTQISVVGGVLSGGQRQRIGLARAVYGNPSLIVLDEPNSNLDDQGEQALLTALQELKRRKVTVILISHRKPILRLVDKMLVLSGGRAVAFGGRDDVMRGLQDGSIAIGNKPAGRAALQGGGA
ncbi:MAG: type I secretion system permease/ATPase [Pseudomonadales bacterium]|uniref:type I secretion system permease/ATPase n=1 Tax=Marinobacter xestospongiae TaxID=994319 RepID=UPI002004177F|nr:type I secretion system permease/ATPase [Marinobacter xestospongiae]MCG8516454.1 type I secretion system permease/ATPase [Pseudomonadales bacterium]MCK7569101.1 type I secretion system permease/ATPase [Marinobacter xestospongiae]